MFTNVAKYVMDFVDVYIFPRSDKSSFWCGYRFQQHNVQESVDYCIPLKAEA